MLGCGRLGGWVGVEILERGALGACYDTVLVLSLLFSGIGSGEEIWS